MVKCLRQHLPKVFFGERLFFLIEVYRSVYSLYKLFDQQTIFRCCHIMHLFFRYSYDGIGTRESEYTLLKSLSNIYLSLLIHYPISHLLLILSHFSLPISINLLLLHFPFFSGWMKWRKLELISILSTWRQLASE